MGCASSVPRTAPTNDQIRVSITIAKITASAGTPNSPSTLNKCVLACREKCTALKMMKTPTTKDNRPKAVKFVCRLCVSCDKSRASVLRDRASLSLKSSSNTVCWWSSNAPTAMYESRSLPSTSRAAPISMKTRSFCCACDLIDAGGSRVPSRNSMRSPSRTPIFFAV